MKIERLFLWVCFFLSIALVALGIQLIFRKDKLPSNHPALKYLQYYLILAYTFGFYSYWGSIFLGFLPFEENLEKFIQIIKLMGVPFLFLAIIMQYLWIKETLTRKVIIGWYLVGIATLLLISHFAYNYYLEIEMLAFADNYKLSAAAMIMINSFILFSKRSELFTPQKKLSIGVVVLLSALSNIIFFFFTEDLIFLADTFLFFLLTTLTAGFFVYWAKFPDKIGEPKISFESFFKKHDITQRESEIIMEIYKGKTNQQIADSLFISLQTVKDHTHRIYRKTFVKNRSQLATVLRELAS